MDWHSKVYWHNMRDQAKIIVIGDLLPRYSDLTVFKMAVVRHFEFLKFHILMVDCVIFFQNGGRPPSWIRYVYA